eukprot:1188086-Prorocentrum_minimum.AAC.2
MKQIPYLWLQGRSLELHTMVEPAVATARIRQHIAIVCAQHRVLRFTSCETKGAHSASSSFRTCEAICIYTMECVAQVYEQQPELTFARVCTPATSAPSAWSTAFLFPTASLSILIP